MVGRNIIVLNKVNFTCKHLVISIIFVDGRLKVFLITSAEAKLIIRGPATYFSGKFRC